ncbi:MAG: endonuclease/exonuclease/phosphatase family protein [Paludibacteraceae bacterium]|nr:endonuclease/exonuclease/phosphatase family protein [Paludibacteraceae bacterium]
MKKKLFIAMMVLLPIGATAQDTIRIMTFNLYSVAMTSLEELGGYIKRHNPDIVALQEVNMKTNRADAPAQRDKNQVV